MIPLAYLLGLVGILIGFYALYQGYAEPKWLWAWLAGHVIASLTITVALHRYFSHGAFVTNKVWHTVLAVVSNLIFHGSPQAWATAHITHHEQADTDLDPHKTKLSYLIWKNYRNVPLSLWRLKHLSKDPILKFTHRYALLLVAAVALVLYAISPWALLFGYLMPLGSVHFIGAVHQVTSHTGPQGARNLPLMEFILPASGEWHHKYHHDNPRAVRFGTKWYYLDFGYWFIRLIAK